MKPRNNRNPRSSKDGRKDNPESKGERPGKKEGSRPGKPNREQSDSAGRREWGKDKNPDSSRGNYPDKKRGGRPDKPGRVNRDKKSSAGRREWKKDDKPDPSRSRGDNPDNKRGGRQDKPDRDKRTSAGSREWKKDKTRDTPRSGGESPDKKKGNSRHKPEMEKRDSSGSREWKKEAGNRARPERHKDGSQSGRKKGGRSAAGDRKKSSKEAGSEKKTIQDSSTQERAGIRLNKFIADAGICSRREADKLIEQGEITVNGQVVTQLGTKVSRSDKVKYQGKKLVPEKLVYVLLNKPKDFITTTDDPEDRRTVMDLVKNACEERIYPVGRLDRQTTGLLLLTNDGELAKALAHPSHNVRKIYKVELDQPLTRAHLDQIKEGLQLEDGKAQVDEVAILTPDMKTVGIELHIGRNRIVRRIFEFLGYEVVKLDRVMYAGLDKQRLSRGKWRMLTDKEVIRLKRYQK